MNAKLGGQKKHNSVFFEALGRKITILKPQIKGDEYKKGAKAINLGLLEDLIKSCVKSSDFLLEFFFKNISIYFKLKCDLLFLK